MNEEDGAPTMPGIPERPDCRHCVHYYITWDANFPNGCKAMAFKSQNLPCIDVYQSSGLPCQLFERKSRAKK